MSSTTNPTAFSSPISIGNRARLALVGLAASAALAGGVILVVEDGGDSGSVSSALSQSVRGSGGPANVDPRPEINQRRVAERFHHRLQPVSTASSSAGGVDPHPEINQRRTAERFHHR